MTAVITCRKAAYPDLSAAELALLHCAESRAVKHRDRRREVDCYRCRDCPHWHLTSTVTHPTRAVMHEVEHLVADRQRDCDGCGCAIPTGAVFARHSFEIGVHASLLDECETCQAVTR